MSDDPQPAMLALEASAFSVVEEQNMLYLVEQDSEPDRKLGIEKYKLTLRHWEAKKKLSDTRTVASNVMKSTPVAYLVRRAGGQIYVSAPNHRDQTPRHQS
jgi:hypothetical protein